MDRTFFDSLELSFYHQESDTVIKTESFSITDGEVTEEKIRAFATIATDSLVATLIKRKIIEG